MAQPHAGHQLGHADAAEAAALEGLRGGGGNAGFGRGRGGAGFSDRLAPCIILI